MAQSNRTSSRRRMLINATGDESRVAIIEDGILEDLHVESVDKDRTRGNIYRGTIVRVEPAIQACFVDIGTDRHGFLPMGDLARTWWAKDAPDTHRPRIEQVVRAGMHVMVQVQREPEGNKGAALTTFFSFPGRFVVLLPDAQQTGGVSRKIEDERKRRRLERVAERLRNQNGYSLIIRTVGTDRTPAELERDMKVLVQLWKGIQENFQSARNPGLIYSEQDVVVRSIRDYFTADIEKVIIDDPAAYKRALEYVRAALPQQEKIFQLYKGKTPLLDQYRLEEQIENIYERCVRLRSGGEIVIDRTEALIAIDVNSSRAMSGRSPEDTALQTNLEAAREVARQLRLRDLGGLIVIDFIDMRELRNRRKIESCIRNAMRSDKARYNIGRISQFGLLEMTRQRIQGAISSASHELCESCGGTGYVRTPSSCAGAALRRIRSILSDPYIVGVRAELDQDTAAYLQNEKRGVLFELETTLNANIEIIPSVLRTRAHAGLYSATRGHRLTSEAPVQSSKGEKAHQALIASFESLDTTAATPEANLDPDTDSGRSGRRRGRRGRGRGRNEEKRSASAAEPQGAPAPTPPVPEQSDASQGSISSRRAERRRLRAEQRRKTRNEEAPTAAETTSQASPSESFAPAPPASPSSNPSSETSGRRGRRRSRQDDQNEHTGRRERRSTRGRTERAPEDVQPVPTPEPVTAEPTPVDPPQDLSGGRRARRRALRALRAQAKSTSTPETSPQETQETSAPVEAQDSTPAAEEAPRGRRGRRRTRQTEAPQTSAREENVAPQETSQHTAKSKPDSPPEETRRRGRRGRKAAAETTEVAAVESPTVEVPALEETAPEATPALEVKEDAKPKRTRRSRGRKISKEPVVDNVPEAPAPSHEEPAQEPTAPAKPKRTRRTRAKQETAPLEAAEQGSTQESQPAAEEPPSKPRRGRKTRAKASESVAEPAAEEKPKRARRTRKKAAEEKPSEEAAPAAEEKPKRARRTRKKAAEEKPSEETATPATKEKPKRKTRAKTAKAVDADAEAAEETSKPKRARRSRKKAEEKPSEDATTLAETTEEKPKRARRGRRTRKTEEST